MIGVAGRLSGSRIKRDTSNIEYFPFTIDDILDKVIITITVGKSGKAINLVTVENPQKKEVEASEVLSQSKIYEINNPIPGVWKILKPKKVGGLDFIVRGLPKVVLEFGYIFFYRPGDEAPLVPISYPLIGEYSCNITMFSWSSCYCYRTMKVYDQNFIGRQG